MKKTEQKVLRFIDEKNLLEKDDRILVALSGGPDSVFLLHFLNKYSKKFKISLSALHINHGLRGKAALADEHFCKKFTKKSGIRFYSVKRDVKALAQKLKISTEEAGRLIRYEEFEKFSAKEGFSKIATAHIADDNAETVLLNLIKGTGLNGISGIPFSRGKIIRPLLVLTKEENNFVKKRLNEEVKNLVLKKDDIVSILLAGLDKIDSELRGEAIRLVFEKEYKIKLSFQEVKRIFSLIEKQPGRSISLQGKLKVVRERNELVAMSQGKAYKQKPVIIGSGDSVKVNDKYFSIKEVTNKKKKFNLDKNIEFINGDNIHTKFILRRWQPGDRFIPLGMKGSKKVSDFLSEQRLSSYNRKDQMILINNNRIVWIIGLRLDNRFRITPQTKKIYELCI